MVLKRRRGPGQSVSASHPLTPPPKPRNEINCKHAHVSGGLIYIGEKASGVRRLQRVSCSKQLLLLTAVGHPHISTRSGFTLTLLTVSDSSVRQAMRRTQGDRSYRSFSLVSNEATNTVFLIPASTKCMSTLKLMSQRFTFTQLQFC